MCKLLWRRSLGVVACSLLFATAAYADAVKIGFGNSAGGFSLTITGGPLHQGVMYGDTLGSFWKLTYTVKEEAGATDKLTVTVMVQHFMAPHGESPNEAFTFTGVVGTQSTSTGPFTVSDGNGKPINHPPHFDLYSAKVTLFGFATKSTGYTFHVEGKHCTSASACSPLPPEKDLPEPATLLLLGTGLGGVALKLRNRFSKQSGQPSSKPFA